MTVSFQSPLVDDVVAAVVDAVHVVESDAQLMPPKVTPRLSCTYPSAMLQPAGPFPSPTSRDPAVAAASTTTRASERCMRTAPRSITNAATAMRATKPPETMTIVTPDSSARPLRSKRLIKVRSLSRIARSTGRPGSPFDRRTRIGDRCLSQRAPAHGARRMADCRHSRPHLPR